MLKSLWKKSLLPKALNIHIAYNSATCAPKHFSQENETNVPTKACNAIVHRRLICNNLKPDTNKIPFNGPGNS
jgi:hypothetical protein